MSRPFSYNDEKFTVIGDIQLYIQNNSLYSSSNANLSGGQFFAITNLKDI